MMFEKYELLDKNLIEQYEFRCINQDEIEQAAEIEKICFSPNEVCSYKMMKDRIENIPDLFLVAIDKKSGKIAGSLNGIATNEDLFKDDFFINAKLHNPEGKNIMILGLAVLPEYRGQGLAREIMFQYLKKECNKNRQNIILTCHESKIKMYEKMGFKNCGISNSFWGSEQWYEMRYTFNM